MMKGLLLWKLPICCGGNIYWVSPFGESLRHPAQLEGPLGRPQVYVMEGISLHLNALLNVIVEAPKANLRL